MNRLYSRRDILLAGAASVAYLAGFRVEAKEYANKVDEDAYDEVLEIYDVDPIGKIGRGKQKRMFKMKATDLDEPIKKPDDTLHEVRKGYEERREVEITPTNFAVWTGIAHKVYSDIGPNLLYLDMDNDNKPEELGAGYWASYPEEDKIDEILGDHYVKYKVYWLIWPYDMPEESKGDFWDAFYVENPSKIKVLGLAPLPEDVMTKIPWKIRLDGYDKYVKPTTTPSPAETRQMKEKRKGTEKPTEPEPRKIDGYTGEEGLGGILGGAGVLTIGKLYDKYMSRKK